MWTDGWELNRGVNVPAVRRFGEPVAQAVSGRSRRARRLPAPRQAAAVGGPAWRVLVVEGGQRPLDVGAGQLLEVDAAQAALGGQLPVRAGADTGGRAEEGHCASVGSATQAVVRMQAPGGSRGER